jgi:hypothetical protein
MEAKIKELKQIIDETEVALKDTAIMSDAELVSLLNIELDKAKKELADLEALAEKEVVKAEKKVEKAETKAEVKEAKEELKEAKEEKKEVEKIVEKAEKASDKIERMEKPKGNWGGKRPNAGAAKKKVVASKPTKMVKPKGVQALVVKKVPTKKQVPVKVVSAQKPAKMKTARAFGQTIEYRNDSDFCGELIKAFKKRRKASKVDGKRKKTKPVFGVITTNVKNAVSKALHNVSNKEIEKNPKQFLAKAQRLEKSAIRFLEDFKAILGSDFRKSEITSEFGELEKSIKLFVAKIAKK